jgi:hypothetical protein
MINLDLKPTSKGVKDYYVGLVEISAASSTKWQSGARSRGFWSTAAEVDPELFGS